MPQIATPMSDDQLFMKMTEDETWEDMSWLLKDWAELSAWLSDHGAELIRPDGLTPTAVERVKWMVENVEKAEIINS